MIFVPEKEKCLIWNEIDNCIYIHYCVDGNDSREFPIQFVWHKVEGKYDPNYIEVIGCMREPVLKCPLNACNIFPQLRYNHILNKWYCNCPSSAICTKNDDQDELKEMLSLTKKFDYNNGFCDNPIEAILKWNESCAKSYLNIAKTNINLAKLNRKKLK